MNFIDDSYISFLNMDHRRDRLLHMTHELQRVGLPVNRTRGGRVWEGDPKYAPIAIRRSSTPGSEGCSVGQMAIMEEALNRGKHAWVMEDDLVFCSDFKHRLGLIEEFLDEHEWDVFWFGATFHVNPPVWHKETLGRDIDLTGHPRFVRTYGCWSTYCYVVNIASLAKILQLHTTLLPESRGIDTTFIQMQPDLYTYAFVPGSVKQFDDFGDVGGGWTAFSDFSKLGPYWWQDRMERFNPEAFDWAEAR